MISVARQTSTLIKLNGEPMDQPHNNTNEDGWVWVVVYDSEEDGHYLGLYDDEEDLHFIPAFHSKDEANECFLSLPREKGKKYEIQAVHIEELTEDAEQAGFVVAMLEGDDEEE